MSILQYLKNRIGSLSLFEDSSAEPDEGVGRAVDDEPTQEQCGHTSVQEVDRVYPKPLPKWQVRSGYLFIPRLHRTFVRCNDCGDDIVWTDEDATTLVFRPAYTVDPDVDPGEAITEPLTDEGGGDDTIYINRSENPTQ